MGWSMAQRSRREAFIKLAEARTSRAMMSIRTIGNLANRSNYEYTDEDAQKIVKALEGEIRDLKNKFSSLDSRVRPDFKL